MNKISRKKKHINIEKSKSNIKKHKKNLYGGGRAMEQLVLVQLTRGITFKHYMQLIKTMKPRINFIRQLFKYYFTDDLYNELIQLDQNNLEKYKKQNEFLFNDFEYVYYEYISNSNIECTESQKKILKILFDIEYEKKFNCSYKQIYEYDNPFICSNYNYYNRDCDDPNFYDSLLKEPDIVVNDNIIKLLNAIRTKLEKGKSIGIILGAVTEDEYVYQYDIVLYFNTRGYRTASSISSIIYQIENEPLQRRYYIAEYFPLNTKPDNKRVLDLILELTNDYTIYLVSLICKGLYKSFYYLTENAEQNFQYINDFKSLY